MDFSVKGQNHAPQTSAKLEQQEHNGRRIASLLEAALTAQRKKGCVREHGEE